MGCLISSELIRKHQKYLHLEIFGLEKPLHDNKGSYYKPAKLIWLEKPYITECPLENLKEIWCLLLIWHLSEVGKTKKNSGLTTFQKVLYFKFSWGANPKFAFLKSTLSFSFLSGYHLILGGGGGKLGLKNAQN